MNTLHTVTQRITKLGLILMMGVSMSACSGDQHWKEEVQLSDGRVIVVERELITESGGNEWAINRSGSKPKEYRIRFEYPVGSGKTIEWRSIKLIDTWPEHPLIFDVEENKPIVFSKSYNAVGCRIYLKYVYQDGKWIEELVPPIFEARATNLLIFNFDNQSSLITLEKKRKKSGREGAGLQTDRPKASLLPLVQNESITQEKHHGLDTRIHAIRLRSL